MAPNGHFPAPSRRRVHGKNPHLPKLPGIGTLLNSERIDTKVLRIVLSGAKPAAIKKFKPRLLELLEHKDAMVKIATINCVGSAGGPDVILPLFRCCKDSYGGVAAAASENLMRMFKTNPEWFPSPSKILEAVPKTSIMHSETEPIPSWV